MPHNFIKTNAMQPNPGRWNRGEVQKIAHTHHGTLEYLWFDDASNPAYAYALIKDGDIDGLMHDLHGVELIQLYDNG